MNFLIESVMKYRVSTMVDADRLEQKFRTDGNFTVKSFKKQQKTVKHKEKVGKETIIDIEEYILCTIGLVFNDEKDPCDLTDLGVVTSEREVSENA